MGRVGASIGDGIKFYDLFFVFFYHSAFYGWKDSLTSRLIGHSVPWILQGLT